MESPTLIAVRLFYEENSIDYARYGFPYRVWAEWSPGETLEPFWERGFLPFSGDVSEQRVLFYLARSLRYDLDAFALRKSRRYDHRQVEVLEPTWETAPLAAALARLPPDWRTTVTTWMQQRFGEAYLPPARLEYILASPLLTHLVTVSCGGQWIGLIFLSRGESAAHYWYAFYDPSALAPRALGKWLMARAALWAKDLGLRHLYVGTAYGPTAAYKTQGVDGAAFFDGSRWNSDLAALQSRQAADSASR